MRRAKALAVLATVATVMGGHPGVAHAAQGSSEILKLDDRDFTPGPPAGAFRDPPSARSSPSMGGSTPTAYGADWGDFFTGLSYHGRARFATKSDGSVGAGFGIGDASTWLGVEVLGVSFSTVRSGYGKRAGLDLKIHRRLPNDFAVAIGWESAALRGVTDGRRSKYAVFSKWLDLRDEPTSPFGSLMFSAGIGNGRFRSREALLAREKSLGYFGSVGLRVFEPMSIAADWTGQDVLLLTSIAPLARFDAVATFGVRDFTGRIGDGTRYLLSVSYVYRFDG